MFPPINNNKKLQLLKWKCIHAFFPPQQIIFFIVMIDIFLEDHNGREVKKIKAELHSHGISVISRE